MLASSRRKFLRGIGAAGCGGLGLGLWSNRHENFDHVPLSIGAPNFLSGHRHNQKFSLTREPTKTSIVIVGGGIAGLSAGWWLKKAGFNDFILLELEDETGGNSRSKKNSVSNFPLGAHYIPSPTPAAQYVRLLFEDMGIIESYDQNNKPILNEYATCHSPKERLFIHGTWQDSILPSFGVHESEKDQIRAFQQFVDSFAEQKGGDGRLAFVSPAALSSLDPKFILYDQISVDELLRDLKLDSKHLRWYLEYCCKDDFGTNLKNTSAWALLHYFNARNGNDGEVVTWPEGNGRIVRYLSEYLKDHIVTGAVVQKVCRQERTLQTKYLITETSDYKQSFSAAAFDSDAVICALPRHVSARVIDQWSSERPKFIDSFTYTPWVVANIKLSKPPVEPENGAPLSWDNVSQKSYSLGYVVANHQSLQSVAGPTNITYYLPITEIEPSAAREQLLEVEPSAWRIHLVNDLERMHPGIASTIEHIDLWLWPHAMIRPVPGFISGSARREANNPLGNIFFAHSDLSGMSLFEEAQYHGVEAAKLSLKQLIKPTEPREKPA